MKKTILVACIFLTTIACSFGQKWKSSVAVVVDKVTYEKTEKEVKNYMSSIDQSGKKAILVIEKWNNPDSLRAVLKNLYIHNNLEGAVLIGDVPVPMIRDAQHLATAFKMNQNRDWKESSIPSDRFYDDFDLKFDYVKQDKDVSLYHYYSLRFDSPQQIHCDIYSARIKAPVIPGKDKYTLIAEYLTKVVSDKANKRSMSKILHAAGHGYNSNSMNARIDEAWALKEQFPFLNKETGNNLYYVDHSFDDYAKYRLLGALANPKLDLAILHHHGSEDAQLISGSPKVSSADNWISMTKNFFRSKIRSAKDTAASKKYYIDNYNVPESWVEGTFNPEIMLKDSIQSASLDINIPDLDGYTPGAKVIIFDACFNGSFHLNDYISGHYIFNPGGTIVVKANSVNTLQDIWTDELMGLMNAGVCIGNWAKSQFTLESHLIGDPTFSFGNAYPQFDLDNAIVKEKANSKFWRSVLKSDLPDVKALAMKQLYFNNSITSDELLKIQQNDNSAIVRLEAFMLIKKISDKNLPAAIINGLNDSQELTKRLSALTAAKNNAPELLPVLVDYKLDPTTTERVDFHLRDAIENYRPEDFLPELSRKRKEQQSWPTEERYTSLLQNMKQNVEKNIKDFNSLTDTSIPSKERSFIVSAQRNSVSVLGLNKFFEVLESDQEQSIRLLTAETLGWYLYSCKKDIIIKKLNELVAVEKDEVVKREVIKSINRLTTN